MAFLIGEAMRGGYGAADILNDCTIAVERGQIAVIVGPNGAGKSTAMKAVFGMLGLRGGRVLLEGADITGLSPQERVARGMAFVPQTHNIFTSMTVEENLEMGAFLRTDDIRATMEQVYTLFPILRTKRRQPAGELSGGQRQQVAVGRALMTQPAVLMLDEPTAGVSPIVMDELFDRIIEIARTGISILMVEQNARQALEIADRGYVLVQGANRFTGTGAELLADPRSGAPFSGLIMVSGIVLSAFTLLGTLANGLECNFTERCTSGVCTSVDPSPLRVLFVSSRVASEPATFVIGHRRLFEGTAVTEQDVPAMKRMFGDFGFAPETYSYGLGAFTGYQPDQGGAVQIAIGGRLMNVSGDGKANLVSERDGRPGLDWITSFTGHCSARSYQ